MYTSVRPYCLILRSAGMVVYSMRKVGIERKSQENGERGRGYIGSSWTVEAESLAHLTWGQSREQRTHHPPISSCCLCAFPCYHINRPDKLFTIAVASASATSADMSLAARTYRVVQMCVCVCVSVPGGAGADLTLHVTKFQGFPRLSTAGRPLSPQPQPHHAL